VKEVSIDDDLSSVEAVLEGCGGLEGFGVGVATSSISRFARLDLDLLRKSTTVRTIKAISTAPPTEAPIIIPRDEEELEDLCVTNPSVLEGNEVLAVSVEVAPVRELPDEEP